VSFAYPKVSFIDILKSTNTDSVCLNEKPKYSEFSKYKLLNIYLNKQFNWGTRGLDFF